jgi:hypothetical protein
MVERAILRLWSARGMMMRKHDQMPPLEALLLGQDFGPWGYIQQLVSFWPEVDSGPASAFLRGWTLAPPQLFCVGGLWPRLNFSAWVDSGPASAFLRGWTLA